MIVYRVEHMGLIHPEGTPAGPYAMDAWGQAEHEGEGEFAHYDCNNGDCVHHYIDWLCTDTSKTRPTPGRDSLGYYFDDELFCFPDMEALRSWFRGEMSQLRRLGYIVAKYDVPNDTVRHGRCQSVFKWSAAQRVGERVLR